MTKEILWTWIETIMDEAEDELNDWERNFIASITEQLAKYGKLSEKQEETLERIYANKTK